MPTIVYLGKVRIVIYFKDHAPPHIHAIGPGCSAKFEIASLLCSFSRGFSEKDLHRIQEYLAENGEYLLEVWNAYQKN